MRGTIGILTGRGPACDPLQAWLDTLPPPPALQRLRVPGNQIAWQRNQCVRALRPDDEFLLFVDNDCVPPPGALAQLLSRQVDIVSAVVPERVAPFATCLVKNLEPYERYTARELKGCTELIPVPAAGTGCLLIRPRVFQTMLAPWFRCGQLERAPDLIAEDMDFSLRAAELGFPIWADPLVRTAHKIEGLLSCDADGVLRLRPMDSAGWAPYSFPLGGDFE